MYDIETDKFGMCKNSDLIEELGQVDFIFTDKTGTLTQNKMIFKKCTVGSMVYGDLRPGDVADVPHMAETSRMQIEQAI
jgi:phospholipid-translocating ATPase